MLSFQWSWCWSRGTFPLPIPPFVSLPHVFPRDRAGDLCILTSFGLVRTGCLHSGDPRGTTSCLWFWLPSTPAAMPPAFSWLPRSQVRTRIVTNANSASLVRIFFSVLLHAAAQRGIGQNTFGYGKRIISIEKLNEIYVHPSVALCLAGTYANATGQRPNRRFAIILKGIFPRGTLASIICHWKCNEFVYRLTI